MQPYFMPYMGYIQLMAKVDRFVVYDDVNYINRGWINRNNVLVNGQKTMLTVPLKEASQNKKINEIELSGDAKWKRKMLKTVEMSYKKAPFFGPVFDIFKSIVESPEKNLSAFLLYSLIEVTEYLNLQVEIIPSSSVFNNAEIKKGDRLIDICGQLSDLKYMNPIGGAEIYTKEEFMEKGVELSFLEMVPRTYKQLGNKDFVSYLSILDVMMMNEPAYIKEQLLEDCKIY